MIMIFAAIYDNASGFWQYMFSHNPLKPVTEHYFQIAHE